jgi:hypothetical protein
MHRYVHDEFGSRIGRCAEGEAPSCAVAPFFFVAQGVAYSLLWPLHDLHHADEVTRGAHIATRVCGCVWRPYGLVDPKRARSHTLAARPCAPASPTDYLPTEKDPYLRAGKLVAFAPDLPLPEAGPASLSSYKVRHSRHLPLSHTRPAAPD